MEEDLSIQDVPSRMFRINWEKIKDEIPEIRLKEMIKVLQEDMQLPEEANMLKEKLFLMEASQRQSVIPPEAQGQPTPGGAPGQGVVPGVPR